jgi:hypothetical protein
MLIFPLVIVTQEIADLKRQLVEQQAHIELVTQEYTKQLATNKQLQADREAAKAAVNYVKQDDVQHQVNALGDFFQFMGKAPAMRKRAENLNVDDPKELEAYAKDLDDTMQKGLGIITRIMLHNTEPTDKNKP